MRKHKILCVNDEENIKDSYAELIVHKPFEVDQVLHIVQEGMVLGDRFKAVSKDISNNK